MREKQNKDDVKPRITTTEEVEPAPIRGNETEKPIVGREAGRDMGQRDTQPTRDDGDNDDKGELD